MKLRPVVLLAEPQAALAEAFLQALAAEGFEVIVAVDAVEVERAARSLVCDLVLANESTPNVPATGVRGVLDSAGDARDLPLLIYRAIGRGPYQFTVQPDLYASDPMSMLRLCQHVRSLSTPSPISAIAPHLRNGHVIVDRVAHRVYVRAREVELTALEFRLLVTFMGSQGRVLSRHELLSNVWGIRRRENTRTVDTNVKRLRQKLGEASDLIETLRNVGYRLRPEVQGWAGYADGESAPG